MTIRRYTDHEYLLDLTDEQVAALEALRLAIIAHPADGLKLVIKHAAERAVASDLTALDGVPSGVAELALEMQAVSDDHRGHGFISDEDLVTHYLNLVDDVYYGKFDASYMRGLRGDLIPASILL